MASLHLVGGHPDESPALVQCLARVGEGDTVLLMGEAVHAAVLPGDLAAGGISIRVLEPELAARGLDISKVPSHIRPVDYAGFVALATEHHPIVSWF